MDTQFEKSNYIEEPEISKGFWIELTLLTLGIHFLYTVLFIALILSGLRDNNPQASIGIVEQILVFIRLIIVLILYFAPIPVLVKIFVNSEKNDIRKAKEKPKYGSIAYYVEGYIAFFLAGLIYLPFVIVELIFFAIF